MKFKIGDIVIKTTGGNKMTISDMRARASSDIEYECIWFVELELNNGIFKESEIVFLSEYKQLLKEQERDDKIEKLLN